MSSWAQLGSTFTHEQATDRTDSIDISDSGTIVAVGSSVNDVGGARNNAGYVRVFRYSSGSWSQLGADIDGLVAGDASGKSVRLSADGLTVVIGATAASTSAGQLRVYEYSGGSWSLVGSAITGAANSQLGTSCAISNDGTIIAGGAIGFDSNKGQARAYILSGGSWVARGSVINGIVTDVSFGLAMDLSSDGSIWAISAAESNLIRVYQYGADWVQLGSTVTSGFLFGNDLRLTDAGTRFIASDFDSSEVWDYNGSDWVEYVDLGSSSSTGIDISGDGNYAVIKKSGSTLVYQLTQLPVTTVGGTVTTGVSRLAMSVDGNIIAVGDSDANTIRAFENTNICFVHPHLCSVWMADKTYKRMSNLVKGDKIKLYDGVGIVEECPMKDTVADVYQVQPSALGYAHRKLCLTDEHIVCDVKGKAMRVCDMNRSSVALTPDFKCRIAHIVIKGRPTALCNVNGVWCETGDVTRTFSKTRQHVLQCMYSKGQTK